jgi:hypothetical protein
MLDSEHPIKLQFKTVADFGIKFHFFSISFRQFQGNKEPVDKSDQLAHFFNDPFNSNAVIAN